MVADPVFASAGTREPLSPTSSDPPPVVLPASRGGTRQRIVGILTLAPALVPAALVIAIVLTLIFASGFMSLRGFFGLTWNPVAPPKDEWGIGVFVVGSFLTAVPALALSMVLGLGIAIASTTYLPRMVSRLLDPFVDLLAGIPSVIYGIWGYVTLGPYFGSTINPFLADHLRLFPGFGPPSGNTLGQGLPLAIFLLTLMALPITTLLIRDALRSVPRDLWESGLALGATRWEVVRRVAIPYGRRAIMSAGFLGFGRAFGETVAVAMVIGSVANVPLNFYGTTWTMASAMFGLLDSAYGNSQFLAALSEMALVLLAITLAVNVLGRRLIASLAATDVAGL